MGEQDMYVPGTEHMVTLLTNVGIAVEFERHADMGHAYPPGFAERLPEILTHVVDEGR